MRFLEEAQKDKLHEDKKDQNREIKVSPADSHRRNHPPNGLKNRFGQRIKDLIDLP